MAWKVIGFMHGRDGVGRSCPPIYGPLPRKVWVKLPGERKPRKIASKSALTGRGTFDKADQERKACEYARWLARRDGVALPGDAENRAYGKCFWNTAYLGNGKSQLRVASVSFHAKGVNWGQIIPIPNWDWTPAEPIEELEGELALAA